MTFFQLIKPLLNLLFDFNDKFEGKEEDIF